MDTILSLLVLSSLLQLVVPQDSVASFKAVVEMVSGNSRIFSGEGVKLKCSVPDVHKSTWSYLWFRGSEQLPQTEEYLILWNAHIKDSGKFYCQGVRDTMVGKIHTIHSVPIEIAVDGGWAILQVPLQPGLVGETLALTCRVRGRSKVDEVILYRDGIEVMRDQNMHLLLTNLTQEDQGMYSCRASWDANVRTHSVISADTEVQVLEILSQPVLEIDAQNQLTALDMMRLVCHHQYNAPAPAPPVVYYFYKDNNRLGPATSENHSLAKRTPGQYSCKASVPELGLLRWSEPKSFGQVAGPQMTISQPTDSWPLAPPLPSPHFPKESDVPEESGDVYAESGDMSGDSWYMPEEFGEMSGDSWYMPEEFGEMSGDSWYMPEEFGEMSGDSWHMPEESGDMSGESGDMSGESDNISQDSLW